MKNGNPKVIAQQAVRTTIVVLLLHMVVPTLGQTDVRYELNWSTIDGGGGQSSGGPYKLTGTIGQPDAAWSSGGDYELLGGFWPGGPLCVVNFESFAKFAELWSVTGSDLPADLYEDIDNIVNELDLKVFVDYWLCYCPPCWPLK